MPGSRLPDLPSASPTPETLPHTALVSPPSAPAPQTCSTCAIFSHNLRPPVPNTPLLLSLVLTLSVPGFLAKAPPSSHSHFTDNTRPVGYAVPPAERTGRGPYHKVRGLTKVPTAQAGHKREKIGKKHGEKPTEEQVKREVTGRNQAKEGEEGEGEKGTSSKE